MGCESAKEKIESKMLYLKLERASIREERKNILKELEKITGFEWKRNEIPDYMNINEKIRIENEILGSKMPYVDEKEYYEYHIAKRNKKKFKQYLKKNKKNNKNNKNKNNNNDNNDNPKNNNIEEMKNQSEDEQEIVIKEIDVENELKKRLNEYNINDNKIQIKAIDIINKKHKKQLNYKDDNFYNDLNYIMNSINKNKENEDNNNTIIEENNDNEVLNINIFKNNKNKNEKEKIERNKKKIPSWRDITYK